MQVARTAALLCLATNSLHAEEAPAPATPVKADSFWQGLWAGAGFGVGSTNYSLSAKAADVFALGLPDYGGEGAIGAIQGGYNKVTGTGLVYGGPLDVTTSSISNDYGFYADLGTIFDTDAPTVEGHYQLEPKTMATLAGRIGGLLSKNTMIYGLVGYTAATYQGSVRAAVDGQPEMSANSDFVRTGATIGVGMETRLSQQMSLGMEYRYSDLGAEGLVDYQGLTVGVDTTVQTFRATLNYHFRSQRQIALGPRHLPMGRPCVIAAKFAAFAGQLCKHRIISPFP